MTYRVEQLRGKQWETVGSNVVPLGWKAIELCHEYRNNQPHYPTRVFRLDLKMVDYHLDEHGRRQYALEEHECHDCGSKYHATGSGTCNVSHHDECSD
jgi:hypothetical protein